MKKEKRFGREYVAAIVAVVLFAAIGFLSVASMWGMQGTTKVINYVGYVNGATQRLVKSEMQGHPDYQLFRELDEIIDELITGEGTHNLAVFDDPTYLSNLKQMKNSWEQIKAEIEKVRDGGSKAQLYNLSEEYFKQVRETLDSASQYADRQMNRTFAMLLCLVAMFVLVVGVAVWSYMRSCTLKKQLIELKKIAYFDSLTKMPNRDGIDSKINELQKNPPGKKMAIFMFDMNNLKTVNSVYGRGAGDKLIAEFGRILRMEAEAYGFVGRYGGDEFISILYEADEEIIGQFLARINEKIVSYNLMHVDEEEKISFSVGYCMDNLAKNTVERMINEAEKRMYNKKREIKES